MPALRLSGFPARTSGVFWYDGTQLHSPLESTGYVWLPGFDMILCASCSSPIREGAGVALVSDLLWARLADAFEASE